MTDTDQGETDQNWYMQVYTTLGTLLPLEGAQQACKHAFAEHSSVQPMTGMTVLGNRRDVMTMGSRDAPTTVAGAVDYGGERPLIPLGIDPPEHTSYRRLLDPLFSPKRLDRLGDEITVRANHYIDGFIDAGRTDFTENFATPFPSSVFMDLMGLPQEDVPQLVKMKDQCFHPNAGGVTDPAEVARIQKQGANNFYDYFAEAIAERRKSPKEDDLISGLLAVDFGGRPLSHEELLDICYTLALGGLDTVTATLTLFLAFLAERHDERKRIIEDPSVIPNAVEEMLRWETPAPYLFRVAADDFELGGCPIKKGEIVIGSMGNANLDPDEFPNPFSIDFNRESYRHVSFGPGYHRCLGSHLARRELQIALQEWHRRIPEYQIAPETDRTVVGPLRMIEHLYLTW